MTTNDVCHCAYHEVNRLRAEIARLTPDAELGRNLRRATRSAQLIIAPPIPAYDFWLITPFRSPEITADSLDAALRAAADAVEVKS